MMMKTAHNLLGATVTIFVMASVQAAQKHDPDMHMQHTNAELADSRTIVHFPEKLRIHTLANMRDHLLALSEIQKALSHEQFVVAGEIAEQRLGMSSLALHGAHEVGKFMPEKMAAIGTEMHHSASRFAVIANNAAVEGDVKAALEALSDVTRQCVACHSGYRVQ